MNGKTDTPRGDLVAILGGSLALASLVCLSTPTLADSPARDKAFIQSAYRKMDQAVARKDADRFVAFLSPDYQQYDPGSRKPSHDREQTRKGMAKILASPAQVTSHTTITRISFGASGATVDTSSRNSLMVVVGGKRTEFTGGDTDRDLWVRSGSGWLLKTSRTLSTRFSPSK